MLRWRPVLPTSSQDAKANELGAEVLRDQSTICLGSESRVQGREALGQAILVWRALFNRLFSLKLFFQLSLLTIACLKH